MSRSILTIAALAAAAAVQAPAVAQSSSSIIVSAPVARGTGEPVNGVQQRKQLVANVRVDIADLDLRTAYGRDLLDRRVQLAADIACDRLDEVDPPVGVGGWIHDMGDCRHLAVKNAQRQRWVAIHAAG